MEMLDTKKHSVADRIASLAQPWIRPIVRRKFKSSKEFDAKISVSVVNGYTFIDRFSFDAYNESEETLFIRVEEDYRRRLRRYPERILVDKIHKSRANSDFWKEHHIHLSSPKLGRPSKSWRAEEIRQEPRENDERNAIEAKLANSKR